ncbi:lipid-A-disaccharide synthase [Empedobacter falsenii]|uniref:Lipid-A-disaccharide synthase n=2 Tax=Empedobacter TaxID=59734 RepID=A0ABY8V5H2_9FLAO|nr:MULTISPECIES: lipid-A-disaccharide synthase [Empedobacter]MCA4775910.1 lipid-A-disaccharide synthase [Empedobacter stercoris]MCA4781955.1 lipid-A-disaccharide synthase [Empedobacter stercoris]MCA4810005.1 lipid-A-disaccharide synthase [Empedobacter stercoris]NOJ75429.1 lipid-A-disaccharide synthase [Empedobacter stercoris]QNT15433.1 lipid-A-disaccharide synthase [Empedobacter stercoris]
MKYYIIAGEASGDLHASNLMKELKLKDPHAEFRFWGGDLMQAQGGTLVKHYRDLAFMGFAEVVMNLKTILGNISVAKKDIETYKPDAVILVDYPGFNLRIAEFVKKLGIKVYYYISPQIWAWKTGRVHKIKKVVDKMFVILPFEEEFYQRYDYKVDFVGNPLLDSLNHLPAIDEQRFRKEHNLDERPIIALLPGSRTQEIKVKLPLMLSVEKDFPDYQFVVAGAPSQPSENYKKIVGNQLKIVENKTYDLLRISHAALVTSGTATLETALLKVPEVVCYKGNAISYEIGKRVVKNIRFISLVNLIMDEEVVKELIQYDLTYENIKRELNLILNSPKRDKILQDYEELYHKLGGIGASERTANLIVEDLKNK